MTARLLRDLDVKYAFGLRKLGYSPKMIASELGVGGTVVEKVLARKTYKNVPVEDEFLVNWPVLSTGRPGEHNFFWKGGIKQHPMYNSWLGIKQRVSYKGHSDWYRYGGRGIAMAPEWFKNSIAFCSWVDENLGPRPSGMTLDRIDNNGNYEPGNLRWADGSTQRLNQERVVG